ncbi:MAG: Omp28-related outer membrane protein [Saprospiraceae bacterium]|nr:Omp28-related outer membrane protein [Saprospiraceae bacterium]
MKKLALLLTLAFGLSLTAYAQHNRRVMVEEFTNASCGPCAANNPAFNATLAANADFVTPLKYQVWWPGFDPMYNQTKADVDPRVAYYGVSGVPNGIENGVNFGVPGGYSASDIQAAYNTLTPVTMTLTHSLSADFKTVNVTVNVTSDAALSGNLKLRVAVAEREIIFAAAPGSNGEKEFTNVMRKMLPDADGTATGAFAAGETKTYNFSWQLANYYNLNEVEVVAWLQDDDSKEVWQSEVSEPNTTIPGGNFAKVSLSAAAGYKLICEDNIAPSFNLKNVGTQPLTSADIQYRVDDGPWSTYTWTGNLNANLTTAVSLPAVSFTSPGTHLINIFIASTNNGTQINQVDASGTITVNTFYEAFNPPVSDDFESTFPSAGWALKPTSTGAVWQQVTGGFGAYGSSDASLVANFYSIQSGTLEMYMPKIDLSNAISATLNFDYAYAYYVSGADVFKDRLIIEVSTNCGSTWTSVYNKEGDDLATADPSANSFVPTENDWITESIDLSAYAGVEVMVRFKGQSGYGNNLWMDNVNFAVTTGTKELTSLTNFAIQPNPTRTSAEVRINLDQPEALTMQVFGMDGALVESRILGDLVAGQHVINLDAARYNSGSYRVVLQGKAGMAQMQWIVVK